MGLGASGGWPSRRDPTALPASCSRDRLARGAAGARQRGWNARTARRRSLSRQPGLRPDGRRPGRGGAQAGAEVILLAAKTWRGRTPASRSSRLPRLSDCSSRGARPSDADLVLMAAAVRRSTVRRSRRRETPEDDDAWEVTLEPTTTCFRHWLAAYERQVLVGFAADHGERGLRAREGTRRKRVRPSRASPHGHAVLAGRSRPPGLRRCSPQTEAPQPLATIRGGSEVSGTSSRAGPRPRPIVIRTAFSAVGADG